MKKILLFSLLFLLPGSAFAFEVKIADSVTRFEDLQPYLACTTNPDIKAARRRIKRRLKRKFCLEDANPNSCARILLNRRERDCDGRVNRRDNCPDNSNFNQADSDNNGIGNACDPGTPTL